MKKVQGYAELFKDDTTGVIINKATSDRERYRIAKENALKTVNQDSEIRRLSDEISEIKSLLHQLTKAIT